LTMKKNENRSTKKIVFAVDDDPSARQHLGRFVAALRSQPMNAVEFSAASRQGGAEGMMTTPVSTSSSASASLTTDNSSWSSLIHVALDEWTCPLCTLKNAPNARSCAACGAPRDASPLEIARLRKRHTSSTQKSTPSAPTSAAAVNASEGYQRATIVAPPPLSPNTEEQIYHHLIVEDEPEDGDQGEVPLHFICPITGDVMEDPVVTVDGLSFERRAIEAHFRTHGAVSPVTLMPLESTTISPNLALRQAIQDWKAAIPVASIAVM